MRIKTQDYAWHRWFAWHPVQINRHLVWLETVLRRYNGRGHDYAALTQRNEREDCR